MPLIRVKDKVTKHEYTIDDDEGRRNLDGFEVLDKPATDRLGQPLPPKPYQQLEPASKSK